MWKDIFRVTKMKIIIFIIIFLVIFITQPKAKACPDANLNGTIESGLSSQCFTHYATGPSLILNFLFIGIISYILTTMFYFIIYLFSKKYSERPK